MKILVINPPASDRHDIYTGKEDVSFPLGLAYIISVVKKRVDEKNLNLIDINLHRDLIDLDSLKAELKKFDEPAMVLIGGMSTQYYWIKNICKVIKDVSPKTIIICGGSVTVNSKFLLENTDVDIAVIGEGEKTLSELLEALKNQDSLNNIKGIYFKNGAAVIKNATRPRIEDLDSIEFPEYHFFDTEAYIQSQVRITGYRSLPMIISRGCPYSCNFCHRNFGHEIKYRSVGNIIEEIKELKRRFNIDYFVLWDELPLFDKEWAQNFAAALTSNSLRVSWSCPGRASSITDSDLKFLKLLKRSGLKRISFGVESGSDDMLKRMNKRLTVEQAEKALKITRKAGIKATATFMIGYPGETPDTIKKSADFCKKNLLKTTFYICVALPGSNLYRDCIEKGIIQDEEKYLYTISERGDASKLNINLTEMSDKDLLRYKNNAETAINRFYLLNYINYYGIMGGIFNIARNLFRFIRRTIKGTYFDTP
jgi:radical SAM superfamily enzyme YgiQ (UPF0313 family)